MEKLKLAFVKYNGLSAGGTEKWIQEIAAHLPTEKFDVDFYYCDASAYTHSTYVPSSTNKERVVYLKKKNIRLIQFSVGKKDIANPLFPWIDSNFFEKFDEKKYDVIITAKAGPVEYPFYLLRKPIVEFLSLNAGVDFSQNIKHTIHLSNWQRDEWVLKGGNATKSSVIPIPVTEPTTTKNLRRELDIPANAIVLGMHQRADDLIYSSWPLNAFAEIATPSIHFVIMGGSKKYKEQAAKSKFAKNIHFVAHNANPEKISAFLHTLDIYMHGRADGETFGTVLAEAMIHKLPCISHISHNGANAQAQTMGPGGIFAKNMTEYVNAAQLLVTNKEKRTELSKRAYMHAKGNYTLEPYLPRVSYILESVANGKSDTIVQQKERTRSLATYAQQPSVAKKVKYKLYEFVFRNYMWYAKIITLKNKIYFKLF